MKNISNKINQEIESNDISTTYLTFKISGQHYGISIGNVIEIVQIQPATELPELPSHAKGVINLRGQVVPLIDVNLRFGKPEREYNDRTCIIIVDIDGVHVGLIVDAVEEVLNIDSKMTAKPPQFSAGKSEGYITRIAKIDKYMVLLLDIRLLVAEVVGIPISVSDSNEEIQSVRPAYLHI